MYNFLSHFTSFIKLLFNCWLHTIWCHVSIIHGETVFFAVIYSTSQQPLSAEKLAVTLPICGGYSVGIVRSRTMAMELQLLYLNISIYTYNWFKLIGSSNPGEQKQIGNITGICFSYFWHHAISFGQYFSHGTHLITMSSLTHWLSLY
jgi:hypothetical protein